MKKEEFENILNSYKQREQELIDEHEEIVEILKPLILKPIDGRTLNKRVLGVKFRFVRKYGKYYIVGKFSHLIGYENSENLIALDRIDGVSRGFYYFDACCGEAARHRIEQVDSIDKDKAFNLFKEIDETFNRLRVLFGDVERNKLGSYHFPAYYDILETIFNSDRNIKLTDFYFIRK